MPPPSNNFRSNPWRRNIEETREQALLALGEAIFRDPGLLIQAHWHRLKGKISVAPHVHSGILQLDLNIGMTGFVTVGKKKISIHGVTALAFYPDQEHSMELLPVAPQAEIFSIKIRISAQSDILKRQIFTPFLKLLFADQYLVRALRQLNRVATVESARRTMVCATLAEVLCYWPSLPGDSGYGLRKGADEAIGTGMQKALGRIDNGLSLPPALPELASVANMSIRNFMRHFQHLFGCTPHVYVMARRQAVARELLAHKNHNITEIAEELGFPSIHAFSRWFHRIEGISPSIYRAKHFLL